MRSASAASPVALRTLTAELTRLVDPRERSAAAKTVAKRLGAEGLTMFVADPELGLLLPAEGFPRTLPDAAVWREFLQQCVANGKHTGNLAVETGGVLRPAMGIAWRDRVAAILIGVREPPQELGELESALPFLGAAFQGETAALVAATNGEAARQAVQQMGQLARVLDGMREQLEVALADSRRAHRQLDALVDSMPVGVLVSEASGRIIRTNSQLVHVLRHEGSTLRTLADHQRQAMFRTDGRRYEPAELPINRSVRTGETVVAELMELEVGGQRSTLSVSSAPIEDDRGQIVAAVATFENITDRKELDRQKEEFLVAAAHDLKSPLMAI